MPSKFVCGALLALALIASATETHENGFIGKMLHEGAEAVDRHTKWVGSGRMDGFVATTMIPLSSIDLPDDLEVDPNFISEDGEIEVFMALFKNKKVQSTPFGPWIAEATEFSYHEFEYGIPNVRLKGEEPTVPLLYPLHVFVDEIVAKLGGSTYGYTMTKRKLSASAHSFESVDEKTPTFSLKTRTTSGRRLDDGEWIKASDKKQEQFDRIVSILSQPWIGDYPVINSYQCASMEFYWNLGSNVRTGTGAITLSDELSPSGGTELDGFFIDTPWKLERPYTPCKGYSV